MLRNIRPAPIKPLCNTMNSKIQFSLLDSSVAAFNKLIFYSIFFNGFKSNWKWKKVPDVTKALEISL